MRDKNTLKEKITRVVQTIHGCFVLGVLGFIVVNIPIEVYGRYRDATAPIVEQRVQTVNPLTGKFELVYKKGTEIDSIESYLRAEGRTPNEIDTAFYAEKIYRLNPGKINKEYSGIPGLEDSWIPRTPIEYRYTIKVRDGDELPILRFPDLNRDGRVGEE